jgi:hypothetical protein
MTYTDHNGITQTMGAEELEAVERSGRSSWYDYATTPTRWPEPTTPVVPLMMARPGATEPTIAHGSNILDRNGVWWSYSELCHLMEESPSTAQEVLAFARKAGRTASAVQMQMHRLRELIACRKIRWDGRLLLRGKNAQVYQWPVGFRNPR